MQKGSAVMRSYVPIILITACLATALLVAAEVAPEPNRDPRRFWQSTEAEDYAIDRKEVFEFTQKPTVQRDGNRVIIRFASKDVCDATIVIEKQAPSTGLRASRRSGVARRQGRHTLPRA